MMALLASNIALQPIIVILPNTSTINRSYHQDYPKMNTSALLTGYTPSSISVLDSPSPGHSTNNGFSALIDKYVNDSSCSNEGWEGPSTYANNSNQLDDPQERLSRSSLFGRLPWFTADLADRFNSPEGIAKVILL